MPNSALRNQETRNTQYAYKERVKIIYADKCLSYIDANPALVCPTTADAAAAAPEPIVHRRQPCSRVPYCC